MDDVIQILKTAIEEERRSQERYTQALKQVKSGSSKALLEKLIMEEQIHERELLNELEALMRIKRHVHEASLKK